MANVFKRQIVAAAPTMVCGLLSAALGLMAPAEAAAQRTAAAKPVTFTKDVAPILQQHCQTCHRPGSIAPMSLLTYEEARPWARSMRLQVSTRQMPPWYVDRTVGVQKFKEDPSLSDAEIATIVKWIDGGALQGALADMPAPKQFADNSAWSLGGPPDLIISMPREYTVKARGPDQMINFMGDTTITEDRYVKAIQTKPNAESYRVVHHSNTNLIEADEDESEGGSTFLNEYAMGKNADIFSENTGRLLKAGSRILFNVHYHSIGEEVLSRSTVAFRLYPKGYVPKYVAVTQHVGELRDLDIPPGEVSRHDGYLRVDKPVMITAFQPHMHSRGKYQCLEAIFPDAHGNATRPDPNTTQMINCGYWTMGWSLNYNFADDAMPLLPAGTILHTISWHDNTKANKGNPDPRNWVGWGPRTIDDMNTAWVSLYYLSEDDYQARVKAKTSAPTPTTGSR